MASLEKIDLISEIKLKETVSELHEYVIDETCKINGLSEKQLGKLINEITFGYTISKEYMFNVLSSILLFIRNFCLFAIIICGGALILSLSQNDQPIVTLFSVLCVVFSFGTILSVLSISKLEASINGLDVRAKMEIINKTMSTIEGYESMSERVKEDTFNNLLIYAGLQLVNKEKK